MEATLCFAPSRDGNREGGDAAALLCRIAARRRSGVNCAAGITCASSRRGETLRAQTLFRFAPFLEGHEHCANPGAQEIDSGIVAGLADRDLSLAQQFSKVGPRALDGDVRGGARSQRVEGGIRKPVSDEDAPGPVMSLARRLYRCPEKRQCRAARAAGHDDAVALGSYGRLRVGTPVVDIAGIAQIRPQALVHGPGSFERSKSRVAVDENDVVVPGYPFVGLRDAIRPHRRDEDVADRARDHRPRRHRASGVKKRQELVCENAAPERKQFRDDDVRPRLREGFKQKRAPSIEIVRGGGHARAVERALEIRAGHVQWRQLHKFDLA